MGRVFSKRYIGITLAVLFLLALLIFKLVSPTTFDNFSTFFQIFVTLAYVSLTYEILIDTRQHRGIPHLDVEYFLKSDFSNFSYEEKIVDKERYQNLKKEFAGGNITKKNVVLIKLENIGETDAIDTKFTINYQKTSTVDGDSHQKRTLDVGTIKSKDAVWDILEVFNGASENDLLKVTSKEISYTDIHRQQMGEGQLSRKGFKSKYFSDESVVVKISEGFIN